MIPSPVRARGGTPGQPPGSGPVRAAAGPRGRELIVASAAAVAAAVLAGNGVAAAARAVAPAWSADLDRLVPVVIAAVYAAVVAALLLVLGRSRPRRRTALGLRRSDGRSFVLGFAVWAAAYVAAAAYYLASGAVGGDGLRDLADLLMAVGADNGRLDDASAGLVAVVLGRVLVLSPVAEELLFRGALFGWLRTRLSATWTIGLTAAAFAAIHASPTFLPLALVVGLAAGWLRERTGSVPVTIAAHALQSLIIVALSLAVTGWDTPALLG